MHAFVPAVLNRPRLLVISSLTVLAGVAWAYTVWLAATMDMGAMPAMPMAPPVWSPAYAAFVVTMWGVMMVAMMVPSAAPMVLIFHRVSVDRTPNGRSAVATAAFLGGYLAVWAAFSAVVTGAQWALQSGMLLSAMMVSTSRTLNGLLLVAAGVYQWMPWKDACLAKCRSPWSFLFTEWRDGWAGAFTMGMRHGAFCVGCCWALMALLFVGGVMNLLWVTGITAFVMLEKMAPGGGRVGKVAGAGLVVWGGWMATGGIV